MSAYRLSPGEAAFLVQKERNRRRIERLLQVTLKHFLHNYSQPLQITRIGGACTGLPY